MKKVLSIFLIVVMLAAFSLSCIADSFEDAANDIGKYGIMTGYPDGTLKLENNVTRAQITKMIITALGDGEYGNVDMGFSQFTDVAGDHWAKNYIVYAYIREILSGFPDGSFKPEANVTTHQAIKMILCMLEYDKYVMFSADSGYTPFSKAKLDFPYDYLKAAEVYGLIDVSEVTTEAVPATRGYVAKLLSKALDLPIAKAVEYTTQGSVYGLMDGKNGKDFITLRMELEK